MNKIPIIISLLIVSVSCFSQTYPISNRTNSSYTVQDARFSARYNLFVPKYMDTTQANLAANIGNDSCSAVIYLYSTHSLWYRSCVSGKAWVEIGSGGGGSSTFVGLTDGPGPFTGQSGKSVRVNASENALEYFIDSGFKYVNLPLYILDDTVIAIDPVSLVNDGYLSSADYALFQSSSLWESDAVGIKTRSNTDVYLPTASSLILDQGSTIYERIISGGSLREFLTLAGAPYQSVAIGSRGFATRIAGGLWTPAGIGETVSIGEFAGGALTTGENNTFIGKAAGNSVTTGGNNIYIGRNVTGVADSSHKLQIGDFLYGGKLGGTSISNVSLSVGTNVPEYNKILSLVSTTKAFATPRMTTTQRNAILSPTAGMEIYDVTVNQKSLYNGTSWQYLAIGTSYTDADARAAISLTTTGSSGVATYDNVTGVLNIPNYVGGGGASAWGSITGALSDQTDLQTALDAKSSITGTETLTNKRWTARVGSTASSATPTINTDNYDIYKLTAQTTDITSFTANLTGTPVDGDMLEIQITGTAARAITWGASFVSSTVMLPTTTVTTSTLSVVFQYFTTSSYGNNKWVCVNYF